MCTRGTEEYCNMRIVRVGCGTPREETNLQLKGNKNKRNRKRGDEGGGGGGMKRDAVAAV